MTATRPDSDRPTVAGPLDDPAPPVLGTGAAAVLALLGALGLLALLEGLGQMADASAIALGGGGLSALLPPSMAVWITLPLPLMGTPSGLASLGGLALLVAACGHGVARGDVARVAGGLDLLALLIVGMAWAPWAGAVIGGQTVFLALTGLINRGRGPGGGPLVPGATQVARLLGLVAVVPLVIGSISSLVMALLVAALAPWALARLLFGRWAAPPVRARGGEGAKAPPGATPKSGLDADAEPKPKPKPKPEPHSAPEPGPAHALAPTFALLPDPETDPDPKADTSEDADPGPFGRDPAAGAAYLVPPERLVAEARAALDGGRSAILAVIRIDGLAGIAEHLGATVGAALFDQTGQRLADALPEDATLCWMGDETFAAMAPVAGSEDLDDGLASLGAALAAPFAADMVVEGRAISMEDALHVEVTAVQAEMMADLERWAVSAPGG